MQIVNNIEWKATKTWQMIRQMKLELNKYSEVGEGRDYIAGQLRGNMTFLRRLVMLADVMISPCFFNNHTPQSWHCLPLNATLLPNRPFRSSTPHPPARHFQHLPSSDWSVNERVLL
jgi:hypothetical protein